MKLDKEPCGLRILTEIVINRSGINYDDYLLGRTCRRCKRLMLEGNITKIPEDSNFRIVVKTPDGMPNILKGSELLTVSCKCGATYNIIFYGPVQYNSAGIVAYTIIQMNGAEVELSDALDDMRKHKDAPADVDRWIVETLADEFNDAVRIVNEKGVSLVEEDWTESKYSTGWIEEE
ncbi:hypothetical protein MCP_0465 [Methanocella paludicola SANAE]|uniref:Uncharacterized protein n=1 Tax=Methanocella paludicola (strain DSM 17711 / JCM 13418 / NBRC 101707 / SANAE) TaxID=304371 RepID=D1YVR5_METPS|nr:hypothetical protein [Methanocella paludicola]BAI60537.1 hypothetical protein MCP_0465 [Methanocella paludicola SANAE]